MYSDNEWFSMCKESEEKINTMSEILAELREKNSELTTDNIRLQKQVIILKTQLDDHHDQSHEHCRELQEIKEMNRTLITIIREDTKTIEDLRHQLNKKKSNTISQQLCWPYCPNDSDTEQDLPPIIDD
jgi:predicted RNase H-like nuclease (RuvC/YqgF family)